MTRKSSIHFKQVSNVRFAVSHAERTDLSEPEYLLPEEHRLENIVVAGSLSENQIAALFEKEKAGMTGQAKARKSSPFWEGVVVLDGVDAKKHTEALLKWKTEYEKTTGHKVLHMSVHLDEGYLDDKGKPQYNPHAHVIVSRMDSKNRIISLGRKQLADVQDLTASTLQMQRGSTLEEREGMRGRKHVPHRQFREQAEEGRLELDKEKSHSKTLGKMVVRQSNAVKELKSENDTLKAQIAELKAQYKLDREAMKASGEATQAQYQALKIKHEAALERIVKMDEYTKKLEADVRAKDAKIAAELVAKAEVIEALVREGTKSQALLVTSEGHREAAAKLLAQHEEYKAQAVKVLNEASAIANNLTAENTKLAAEAQKWKAKAEYYEAEKAKGTPAHLIDTTGIGTNKPLKTPAGTFLSPSLGGSVLKPEKTPREAFMALYGHLKTVLVGMIDGMRLDAADGRLGLFSQPNGRGSRIEVLCEVPENKVMPEIGAVFDSRAVPGQSRKNKGPGI